MCLLSIFFLGILIFIFPFTYLILSYPLIFFQNDYITIYSPVYIAHLLFSYIFLIRPYLDKFAIYIGDKIIGASKSDEEKAK